MNWGMRVLQTLALPLGYGTIKTRSGNILIYVGAGDEARTRYLHLGKVALYRMSYTRVTLCIIARFSDLSRNFFAHSVFCYRPSLE